MNKTLRAGALALSLAAALAATVTFSVQSARVEEGASYAQSAEAAVLKQGSRGEDVKTVQQKLKRWGYYTGSVDGIYGAQTKKAVEYFQRKNGLVADGIVGSKTYAALGMMQQAQGGSQSSQGTATNSDTYLLARCIYGEARGESYTGQVAVGAVVLNRVKSPQFPNTISGRDLPKARVYGGERRTDQPHSRPDGDQCGEGRAQRLGSDGRGACTITIP